MRRVVATALLMSVAGTWSAYATDDNASKRVRDACSTDAKRFCPRDKFGSSELRYCMEANGRRLSRTCVQALEDDGVVPRGYFKS